MTVSDEFLNSICNNEVDRHILDVMMRSDLSDFEKIELLVKYLEEVDPCD